jgi:DNA-binding XRE family transcriptional regulator
VGLHPVVLTAPVVKAAVRALRHVSRPWRRDPSDADREGLTQEAFAAHIELDRSYYGAVERGEHNVTVETLAVIAAGLGMPAWKLLRRAQL